MRDTCGTRQPEARGAWKRWPAVGLLLVGCWAGCAEAPVDPCEADPASCVASYVGSAACLACHTGFAAQADLHGHGQALKEVLGSAPQYPAAIAGAGVPAPPPGVDWLDLDAVIGGAYKGVHFVERGGAVLTDASIGTLSQWNLVSGPTQQTAGFMAFAPDADSFHAYGYDCSYCHASGAADPRLSSPSADPGMPRLGEDYALPGVQCESCHGPGSLHLPNPSAGRILVDASTADCARCHARPDAPTAVAAADGFLIGNQQSAEVQASPHRGFACTVCHDPHASVLTGRDAGIRNTCQSCHTTFDLSFHTGVTFVWGDYAETMTCASCHMPLAGKLAASAVVDVVDRGQQAVIGDVRSHLMRLDTNAASPADLFAADGRSLAVDDMGQGAVPAFVSCQRCHHGQGNAFPLSIDVANEVAKGVHFLSE